MKPFKYCSLVKIYIHFLSIFIMSLIMKSYIYCIQDENMNEILDEFCLNLSKQVIENNKLTIKYDDIDVYLISHIKNKKILLKYKVGDIFFIAKIIINPNKELSVFNNDQIIHENIILKYRSMIFYDSELAIEDAQNSEISFIYQVNSCYVEFMEYCDMGKVEFMDFEQQNIILVILYDVLKGLYYLHKKGFTYCDLSLRNILGKTINGKIVYKIYYSKFSGQIKNYSGFLNKQYSENINYLAPEVFLKHEISAVADVFSFGSVYYHLYYNYKKFLPHEMLKPEKCSSKSLKDKSDKKFCYFTPLYNIEICESCIICNICDFGKNSQMCENCKNCGECIKLQGTIEFVKCGGCEFCMDCAACEGCTLYENCADCKQCNGCEKCIGCLYKMDSILSKEYYKIQKNIYYEGLKFKFKITEIEINKVQDYNQDRTHEGIMKDINIKLHRILLKCLDDYKRRVSLDKLILEMLGILPNFRIEDFNGLINENHKRKINEEEQEIKSEYKKVKIN